MKVNSRKPSAGCSSRENVAAQQLAAQKAAATTLAVMNGGGPGDPPESTEPSTVIHVHNINYVRLIFGPLLYTTATFSECK